MERTVVEPAVSVSILHLNNFNLRESRGQLLHEIGGFLRAFSIFTRDFSVFLQARRGFLQAVWGFLAKGTALLAGGGGTSLLQEISETPVRRC